MHCLWCRSLLSRGCRPASRRRRKAARANPTNGRLCLASLLAGQLLFVLIPMVSQISCQTTVSSVLSSTSSSCESTGCKPQVLLAAPTPPPSQPEAPSKLSSSRPSSSASAMNSNFNLGETVLSPAPPLPAASGSGANNNQTNSIRPTEPKGRLSGHLRFEFQRYDGWYNNLANSDWGTPNSRLRRKVAPAYSDGVYQMADEGRPSARLLSQRMMRGDDGQASRRNLTTAFAFFGQVISSEILMASESGCPIEMHRIKIERCDPMYDRDCRGGRTMPFYRAAYDPVTGQSPNLPREQLNRVTSWIDASFIYSTSETWLNTMRSFDGHGTLKMVEPAPVASTSISTNGYGASANYNNGQGGALGDAHLHETMGQLLASASGQLSTSSTSGSWSVPLPGQQAQQRLKLDGVPLSLFGYPVRNKQRAPLHNQMPAHHLQMKTAERMFLLGDPRTNQNPMILSFGILFYRWHNVLAERIYNQHPDWSDEEIFQRARRLVIASLQNVFLYEYLPTLLDTPSPHNRKRALATSTNQNRHNHTQPKPDLSELATQAVQNSQHDDPNDLIRPYEGYKPDLHPGISHVFQTAAFRFGHTMIPPGLYLRNDKCHFLRTPAGHRGVRLCSTWWNAEEVVSRVGIEQLLMGAASQIAEREDWVLCNDVRDKLFGPLDFSRRDLAALNIMRGRDNGLADYNTVRQAFKLPRITRWHDINPTLFRQQPQLFDELAQLYGNRLDNVDLYIGGMLESDLERGRPGPLFRRIIKEQFERLRDSDRFWFENSESGIFNEAEIEEIRQIKLYDIIINSTLIPDSAIQRNVFQFVHGADPCPQPGQLSSSQLQPCYIVRGHSYFKGNEQTYLLVCLTLIAIPILCALAAWLLVRQQDRKRRRYKAKQEYQRNLAAASGGNPTKSSTAAGRHDGRSSRREVNAAAAADEEQDDEDGESTSNSDQDQDDATPRTRAATKSDRMYAKEWLHSNLKRKIKMHFGPAPDESLYVLDRKCQVQRRLSLAGSSTVVVELSASERHAYSLASPVALSPPLHPLRAGSGSYTTLTSSTASLVSGAGKTSPSGGSDSPAGGVAGADKLPLQLQASSGGHLLLSAQELDELDEQDAKPMVLIRVARQYDLVLQFSSPQHRRKFVFKLHAYLGSLNKSMALARVPRDVMLANAETKERRQQRLEQFFREAYALTFGLSAQQLANDTTNKQQAAKVSPDIGLVMRTSLSRQEFAEALGMRADSLFVKQMFNCIDKDANGQISFQEFLDLVVKFSRGRSDDRLRIVFDMCDHNGRGVIEKAELVRVLRSLVDMARTKSLGEQQVLQMIDEMFQSAGLTDKQLLDYEDFKLIINSSNMWPSGGTAGGGDAPIGSAGPGQPALSLVAPGSGAAPNSHLAGLPIGLDMKGAKKNFLAPLPPAPMQKDSTSSKTNTGPSASAKALARKVSNKWKSFATELEEHRQDIVYLVMFFVIVVVLFLERFINYSFLSEHMDLRHVMGVGIAITRGSAASLSFCYAMLLLSMCRNLMTWIRTMGVREYIPLDSHVKFHKIVAITALVMTVLHTVGHCINFYHVTQQPVEHLRCLTKEMQFSGEARPTFFYWIFQTVTGSTGLLLWILCSLIYVFAHQQVRQRAYSFFWSTHQLYYLIYALTLLHGSSKLTGSPRFWCFFMIPAILFTIDKIMSLKAKLWQLEIFETECLPSDVIAVKFARPPSFKFLSGQWVRVACTAFRTQEFHAFTLTSAPQADYLSIHVRAQGPWTWKLRSLFDPANLQYKRALHKKLPPRIRIEGPFGGGNQDWYKYEVAVMIGGGIGVTPYASILNDLVFGTSTSRYSSVNYKKVYFIWICPSHRSFEWFIDVLRDVEQRDVTNLLEMHIFITQFFHKFDLRTTMLYICENHFQRISNRSLFTGLKAVNHFGRPDLASFLQQVQNKHACVSKVGVFSCGPKAMTKSVTEACEKVNKRRKLPFFLHQYENFS